MIAWQQIKKFMSQKISASKDEKRVFLTVSNKLKRLGADLGLKMKDKPKVKFNLYD